ncbi:MAG TPA: hypothetical protein VL547_20905 [Dinghuibacter sp.]|uniref:hypothetical protein n=1 Tax=Dinghuibacter sp. TaxID=2024697 RepID=UPI002C196E0E|nr:hypothetical protein [Dinghuibacter sp.]HTJ14517.1 hypothetical protein [Dinghuibacter sp.]
MRFVISLLLIVILSLAAGIWLPFWSVALVAFAVSALIPQAPGLSLICGFLAVFLTWAGLAFFLDHANHHLLGNRISQLFFKAESPLLLVALTGFVGGVIGGLSALSGSFVHKPAAKRQAEL